MTGYLRIGGAFILGVLIVLGAFVIGKGGQETSAQRGTLEVAQARTYIESTDSDSDGIPDWEERATERVFTAINTPTSTFSDLRPYEEPTTFTGKFAEAFFEDYMSGKTSGADLSDPTELINEAVSAIEVHTASKLYGRTDITVIPDSDFAFREYGNAVGAVLLNYPNEGIHEMNALQVALEKNDPSLLKPLEHIYTIYEHYVADMLTMPVPQSFTEEHLALINTCEAIRADLLAMKQIFEDPLYGLARIKRYEDDAKGLAYAFQNTIVKLGSLGVIYADEEPGHVLYLFGN